MLSLDSGLRYLKTVIAHTTLYQCCVSTKKQDRVVATFYLQCLYNAGPMSKTLGQELTSIAPRSTKD